MKQIVLRMTDEDAALITKAAKASETSSREKWMISACVVNARLTLGGSGVTVHEGPDIRINKTTDAVVTKTIDVPPEPQQERSERGQALDDIVPIGRPKDPPRGTPLKIRGKK